MNKIVLDSEEIGNVQSLVKTIASQYQSVEHSNFLRDVTLFAHQLPLKLRKALNDFRTLETFPGICLISGYPIDQKKIGKTPSHWNARSDISPALEEEIFLMLCGSLLGEVFGFLTEQNGRLVNDVLPIKEHESDQVGSSSDVVLGWHNEDAFHPFRADYLGLMCMRNPYHAVTRYVSIDMICLDQREKELLFESHFVIRPDNAHLHHLQELENLDHIQRAAIQRIHKMAADREKVPVLFGDIQSPYINLDPYYMDPIEDVEAAAAFENLVQRIETNAHDLDLQPGDIVFIDNYKTVHGRKPFKAMYDGNDRWLKRINITRDLRKSRAARSSSESRILV